MRLIGSDGSQVGVVPTREALTRAESEGLDLVEVVANCDPPVCKIINWGKFRYDQTKREKEGKKAQHQIKVKEIKVKPNISDHDLDTKAKQMKKFLLEGNKVKLTCTFRGREMAHTELGTAVMKRVVDGVQDIAAVETPAKLMGRSMTAVLAPSSKRKTA